PPSDLHHFAKARMKPVGDTGFGSLFVGSMSQALGSYEYLTAKSVSIKDAKRRPGDRARKATELTPGDLLCVAAATGSAVRRSDRRAEVSRGHSRSCRRQG